MSPPMVPMAQPPFSPSHIAESKALGVSCNLASHGSQSPPCRRLPPRITDKHVKFSPLPTLPTVVMPVNITCHAIEPFRGQGEGPRKYFPENNFPIVPVECRKGDPLMIPNGSGIPDERAMSVYWSSDFYRPIDEVDSDDEDDTMSVASVPFESPRTGMMGTVRPAPPSRGRRSVSVMSNATFLPDSPQSSFSAETSTPKPLQSRPSRSSAPSSMLPPVGIERDGMIKLTRHLPFPQPLFDTDKPVPQGISGSAITVRPQQLVLREIMNPLQYVRLAEQQAVGSKTGELVNESELDAVTDMAHKAIGKRQRPTEEQIDKAAHKYARLRTGSRIGIEYWKEHSDFIHDHDHHIANLETEGG